MVDSWKLVFKNAESGPTAWNGLPAIGPILRLTPVAHSALFLSGRKTTLFDRGSAANAPE